MLRSGLRARPLLAVAAVLAVTACQPVDEIDEVMAGGEDADDGGSVSDLDALTERVQPTASEWDGDGRLVELAVRLDEAGEWLSARTTYVAPDAERMLVIEVDEEGLTEQEPTLETLGFLPPPPAALEQVPALPSGMVEPGAAAEAAADTLAGCDIEGHPREVVYVTGVPGTWDGGAWTSDPAWRVSVLAEGGGVRVALDGQPFDDGCFDVP